MLLQTIVDDEQQFNWDVGNIGHVARHGVSPEEAEQAILDPNAILMEIQEWDEERVESVGATSGGRILVVVFTWRGDAIRPITAYAAPVRIQKLYLKGDRV